MSERMPSGQELPPLSKKQEPQPEKFTSRALDTLTAHNNMLEKQLSIYEDKLREVNCYTERANDKGHEESPFGEGTWSTEMYNQLVRFENLINKLEELNENFENF